LGRGYYTIGPCGEELLGFVGLNLQKQDLTALHYRHLSTSLARQIKEKTLENIALDRARGFTVSTLDPVTAGRHCSIGGNPNLEYLVSSTLASQAPAALGRALSIPLSNYLLGKESKFASNAVSYVSVGDGSVNNAHFLSALNLAKYSEHNKIKCPLVFAVSDNKICISLKGTGYIDKFVEQLQGIHTAQADGRDFLDIYMKSKSVIEYSRKLSRPSLLLISNLPRRFGHAATDRQFAYCTPEEIQGQIDRDPLSDAFSLCIRSGIYTEEEFQTYFDYQKDIVQKAFDIADQEPKNSSRDYLLQSTTAPLAESSVPLRSSPGIKSFPANNKNQGAERPEVMRKHMTRVFDELLGKYTNLVYIGEDVQHGGYYLVTDGLQKKYPAKVRDFPPDETTLVGAAIGFAQSGLVPILEIPYAKYLDCGADMFYEAIISYWLSNGKQPNGMVVRLQGFGKGIFGGNFHTHNMLTFPPGLDVVCFSNGYDYARGMRYAVEQAEKGRIVMSVDSTDLLNRRHLLEEKKDEFMLTSYPTDHSKDGYHFDEITVYKYSTSSLNNQGGNNKPKIVIISYGNGIPTSALAQMELTEKFSSKYDIEVIDTPCLSKTPEQLLSYFKDNQSLIEYVIFADECKYGPQLPLSMKLMDLQKENLLSKVKNWRMLGASPTYNPLGTYLTFLSKEDILSAVEEMKI
jgi:2-oxoisovalerate dehydrogenase E1 component